MQENIKNLKINYIDIENFKNISGISTALHDWNIVGGWNGNGKSSFLEAILTAIQGHKFFGTGAISPSSLVQNGENKATIKLSIKGEEKEIVIERVFIKGTKKKPTGDSKLVATMNEEKISQKDLDKLLNNLTLDPLALANLTKSKQIAEIKATIGLDTSEIDEQIEKQEELTKESRANKTRSLNIYEDYISSGCPEKIEKVKIEELFEAKNDYINVGNLHNKKENILNKYVDKKDEIAKLEKALSDAKIELEKFKTEGKKIETSIKDTIIELDKKHGSIDKIDEQINEAENINEKADKYTEFVRLTKQKEDDLNDFNKDKEKLEELRSDKIQIISESDIPDYMEISEEEGIIVDGIEYKLLNTARKIEVAIDLILISGSPLRMIRIEQGAELDTRTLEAIKPTILKHGFQIFIERNNIDRFDTIIIDNGDIIDNKEEYINNNK